MKGSRLKHEGATAEAPARNARNVLKQLRTEILEMEEGRYLGSGDELSTRLGISRPTLHQVARALEHEQLVEVRRGPNGGYYVRRPSLNAAVAAVATYLRSSNANIWHFVTLSRVIHLDVCRLAARSRDEGKRALLAIELAEFWSGPDTVSPQVLTRRDYMLEGILFDLAGNRVVELFMRSMHHFGYETIAQNLVENAPERIAIWMSHRRRLCESLLAGEERIAMAISQSNWDHVVSWLEEVIGPDPEAGAPQFRLF